MNSYAKYNQEKEQYQATIDISNDIEPHISGEYTIEVHVADGRADQKEVWKFGSFKAWFKEGQDDGSNVGIKKEFQPDQTIVHIFTDEEIKSAFVVSLDR